jgi:hypothetical protein
MWQADFAISCSMCGGDEFRELFPVPAEVFLLYGEQGQEPRRLVATVYACVQCGHLERFVDWDAPLEAGEAS